MKVLSKTGRDDIAFLYIAEMRPGKCVEFVESQQPPVPKSEKWVLIVSTLFGCPVGCGMCDAGGWYEGRLTKEEIFAQIDYLICKSFPERKVPVKKFKIQFARMGEPAFNPAVLDVLQEFSHRYRAPGFIPSISTIAPEGSEPFFSRLLNIKKEYYSKGNFQLQFSIHTTDKAIRDKLIPAKKWDFSKIADYANKFFSPGDRKITLNFALAEDSPFSAEVLTRYFNPEVFFIKITPVNPTINALKNKIGNFVINEASANESEPVKFLRDKGYDVLVSIGELEENKIGSNCGQYVKKFLDGDYKMENESYRFVMQPL
jgi:23S rRNA (adenine2503-C2)-methyltransferase